MNKDTAAGTAGPLPGPVVFLHVPKTGGVALDHYLSDALAVGARERRSRTILNWWERRRLGGTLIADPRFMAGHHPFEALAAEAQPEAAWVTLVRDPVERVLSEYGHIRRHPGDYPRLEVSTILTLEELLADPAWRFVTSNCQTRYLAWAPESDLRAFIEGGEVSWVPDDALDIALGRLRSFAVVGVTEQLHATEQLLAFTLGLPPTPPRPPVNVGGSRVRIDDLPAELVEELRTRNQLDAVLHREAQRLLAARHQAMVDHLLQERHRQPSDSVMPPEVDVDLAAPLTDPAWHQLETRPDGRTFRWIQSEAAVEVFVDRREPIEVRAELVSGATPRSMAEAVLLVDGETLPPTRRSEDDRVVLTVEAPAHPERWWWHQTTVAIRAGETSRISPDPRDLGVAVLGLRITATR